MIRLYTGRQRSSQSLTLWRTASARVGVGPWGRAGPRATSAGNTVFPHGAKHATAGLAEPPVSRNDARPNGGAEQRQPHADSSLNVLNDSTLDTDTRDVFACQGETKRVAFRQMSECGSLVKPTHVSDACTSGPSMYEVGTVLV